mmetsp:Transcript_93652/g.265188  ORF Transcript_93652/g.265188 Transcript_93652/m.265188 type:complete len:201 (-) Transcript_93652:227-829(-)
MHEAHPARAVPHENLPLGNSVRDRNEGGAGPVRAREMRGDTVPATSRGRWARRAVRDHGGLLRQPRGPGRRLRRAGPICPGLRRPLPRVGRQDRHPAHAGVPPGALFALRPREALPRHLPAPVPGPALAALRAARLPPDDGARAAHDARGLHLRAAPVELQGEHRGRGSCRNPVCRATRKRLVPREVGVRGLPPGEWWQP